MSEKARLMRVSELSQAAGVSVQTIHYYVREGLLAPPMKTAPNMAYYGPEYVEDIKLIKELQAKRYLPLSVIKMVLEAKRLGKDVGDLQDMRLSLEEIFSPLGPEESMIPVSLVGLVALCGLPSETVDALEGMGLVGPSITLQGKRYDGLDVRVAKMVKRLLDLGATLQDLDCYADYVKVLQAETRATGRLFRSARGRARISGVELKRVLDTLKEALAAKVYRRAAVLFHSELGLESGMGERKE